MTKKWQRRWRRRWWWAERKKCAWFRHFVCLYAFAHHRPRRHLHIADIAFRYFSELISFTHRLSSRVFFSFFLLFFVLKCVTGFFLLLLAPPPLLRVGGFLVPAFITATIWAVSSWAYSYNTPLLFNQLTYFIVQFNRNLSFISFTQFSRAKKLDSANPNWQISPTNIFRLMPQITYSWYLRKLHTHARSNKQPLCLKSDAYLSNWRQSIEIFHYRKCNVFFLF